MTKVNIEKLKLGQLIELKEVVEAALEAQREAARKELKRQMVEMVAAYGFDLTDVVDGKNGRSRKLTPNIAPKYRHAKDASLTWTGRGRRPNWLVAELEKGKKLEKLLVENSA